MNSGLPKTNPSSGREEDLNPGPPPLEFTGFLSPDPSGISNLFGRGGEDIFWNSCKDLSYIFSRTTVTFHNIPHLDKCQSHNSLCFKQIHELLGLKRDHRYSKAANIQEKKICENLIRNNLLVKDNWWDLFST